MRQLRDYAGLDQVELAARAHYPHDYIRAAETGPALPDLPLLSAYVRGCGGTLEEWEDRWRRLTNAPALKLLPVRSAGSSTAASAGTRVGLAFQDSGNPDPAAIMAALDRVAEKIAAQPSSPPRSSQAAQSPAVQSPAARPLAASAPSPVMTAKPGQATAARFAAPLTPLTPAAAKLAASAQAAAKLAAARPAPRTVGAPGTPKPAGAAPGTETPAVSAASYPGDATGADPSASAATGAGRPFPPAVRTTTAAVIAALVICVIVAVLAIFA